MGALSNHTKCDEQQEHQKEGCPVSLNGSATVWSGTVAGIRMFFCARRPRPVVVLSFSVLFWYDGVLNPSSPRPYTLPTAKLCFPGNCFGWNQAIAFRHRRRL